MLNDPRNGNRAVDAFLDPCEIPPCLADELCERRFSFSAAFAAASWLGDRSDRLSNDIHGVTLRRLPLVPWS